MIAKNKEAIQRAADESVALENALGEPIVVAPYPGRVRPSGCRKAIAGSRTCCLTSVIFCLLTMLLAAVSTCDTDHDEQNGNAKQDHHLQ